MVMSSLEIGTAGHLHTEVDGKRSSEIQAACVCGSAAGVDEESNSAIEMG